MTKVFLCAMRRTPIGRYGGVLAMVRPDDLAAHMIDRLLATPCVGVGQGMALALHSERHFWKTS
jgi:acetyl-CoA acetyltransferase